ncbi:AsmA family protein [bacterium]|nr:AsmA family protein [bacterium]
MKLKSKFILGILVIVCVYLIYYFVLPAIINTKYINNLVLNTVKSEYGFNLVLENPKIKMGLSPSIWFCADNLNIFNDDDSKALSLNKPKIEISIFSLLFRKIHLCYFYTSDLFVDLAYDKEFRFKLGQYLLNNNSKFELDVTDSKIFVNRYKLYLKDLSNSKSILVKGDNIKVNKYNIKKYVSVYMDANLICDNNVSKLKVYFDSKMPLNKHLDTYPPEILLSLSNLDLSNYSNLIRALTKDKIKSIQGTANFDFSSAKEISKQKLYISNIQLSKFVINSVYFDKIYSYPGVIKLKSSYLLSGNHLNIPSFEIFTNKFSAKISGSIDKLSSKKPVPSINIKMFNAKAKDLLDLIPHSKYLDNLADINISVAKDANFNADVDVDLNIKDNFKQPEIYGNINLKNAYIFEPIKYAPSGATIKINYNKDILNLDVNVPTNIKQWVKVVGKIYIYKNKYADLHITSTELIDLALAEKLLDPIYRTFKFLLGPVPIMGFSGYGQIDLTVKGTKVNPHTYGWFKTTNANVTFDDISHLKLTNANSILAFEDNITKFKLLSGKINNKPVNIDGTCTLDGEFDFNANMKSQQLNDLLIVLKDSKMLKDISKSVNSFDSAKGLADFSLNVYGKLKDIGELEFSKNTHAKGSLILNQNEIKLNKNNISLKNISGQIDYNDLNLKVNLFSAINLSKIYISGNLNDDIANINFKTDLIRIYDFLKTIKIPNIYIAGKRDEDFSNITLRGSYHGSISKFDTSKINVSGKAQFKNTNLIHAKNKLPIKVLSGDMVINNNELIINKNNIQLGTMPILLEGKIRNLFGQKPILNISFSAKPNQKFFDYAFNKNSIYPIKAKGDITCVSTIHGELDKLNTYINLQIGKDSMLYYMGAAIGDLNNPIHILFNGILEPNAVRIKTFNYDKLLQSIRGNYYAKKQLGINGAIYYNKVPYFKNLQIKTAAPTDMRIFNIVFKKPLIKGGYFNSNIEINGNMYNPKILGQISTSAMNIPFFDTTINNINLQFLQNTIIGQLNGDVLSNNFSIDINAKNNFSAPYVINSAKIDAKNVNINRILDTLNYYEVESVKLESNANKDKSNNNFKFDINQLIINNLEIVANSVLINKFNANNLKAVMSLKNGVANIHKFGFTLDKGYMDGSVKYNMHSNKYNFNLNVKNTEANMLLSSLFDVRGQIFGDINGSLNLSCTGNNNDECIKSLNGNANFSVKNGRMPKLGSLEYLLKAGNLVKSGITGLSMNGIIDLVTPLKTGNFDSIEGAITFNKGIADNIKILSIGKDLKLYVIGDYNLVNYNANMYVFGQLTRKISTLLGPIGNLSLNTLFSTIPGIDLSDESNIKILNEVNKLPGLEISNKIYRVFAAEIHGDINADDYVQSFRWIE